MSRYLGFGSGGFHFLLNVECVMEVFDAMASAEPLEKVLVSNGAEVYWRGKLGKMLHFNQLLELVSMPESHCYVVCAAPVQQQHLFILQVDAIHALHDINQQHIRPISINNPKFHALTSSVYLDAGTRQLVYLIDDLESLFAGGNAS